MMSSLLHVILLLCLSWSLAPAPAQAKAGTVDLVSISDAGIGAGPVLELGFDGTWSAGWELAFRTPTLVALAMGGSYSLHGEAGPGRSVHYLAFEPWLLVGGTVGLALSHDAKLRPMWGVWEGAAVGADGDTDPYSFPKRGEWVFSLAVGLRGFGRDLRAYVTPKAFWMRDYR